MAGATTGYFYEHDGGYVRILAFVVKADFRNQGIAKRLLQAVEDWAKQIKAATLVLNSGNRPEREAAHVFYIKQGFEAKSTGFVKKLS